MIEFLIELKDLFLLNLNDYSNININFPIIIFFFALTVAFSVVSFIINARNMHSVNLIKQLLRHEAYTEESAKTLSELKIKAGYLLKNMLSQKTGKLTSIVCRVGDTKMTYEQYMIASKQKGYKEEKIDFSSAKFYIPNERRENGKKMVDKDTSTRLKPILATIFLIAIFACIAIVTPDLLDYINRLAGK